MDLTIILTSGVAAAIFSTFTNYWMQYGQTRRAEKRKIYHERMNVLIELRTDALNADALDILEPNQVNVKQYHYESVKRYRKLAHKTRIHRYALTEREFEKVKKEVDLVKINKSFTDFTRHYEKTTLIQSEEHYNSCGDGIIELVQWIDKKIRFYQEKLNVDQ